MNGVVARLIYFEDEREEHDEAAVEEDDQP